MKRKTPALRFRALLHAATVALAAASASCTSMPLASSSSSYSEAGFARAAMAPPSALGTGWGESRDSRVTETSFQRAHSSPDGVGELHYNNADLLAGSYGDNFRGAREFANGRVSVGIKNDHGRWLSGTERGGRTYIKGRPGERYEIVVRNLTSSRIEVVVSVDGLDVLDGRSASFSKRGHLIPAHGKVSITGWRTSSYSVAAFRFAAVEDSYAARKRGETRNVGVIGVAVFTEKMPPLWVAPDRRYAQPPPEAGNPNPFPGGR